jgi:hypothetical protein
LRLTALALLGFYAAVATLHAVPAAPRSALYRPTFLWKDRSQTAGRGFLVSFEHTRHTKTLFISCFHVLGDKPDGVLGLAAISAEEKPRLISSLKYVKTNGQATVLGLNVRGELSVFEIESVPRGTSKLHLATQFPKPGEGIYLFAQAFGETTPRLYKAVVKAVAPEYIEYVFDEPNIELGGTSGGPVLDEQGRVIGINAAASRIDHELHGYANPSVNVIAAIEEVLK